MKDSLKTFEMCRRTAAIFKGERSWKKNTTHFQNTLEDKWFDLLDIRPHRPHLLQQNIIWDALAARLGQVLTLWSPEKGLWPDRSPTLIAASRSGFFPQLPSWFSRGGGRLFQSLLKILGCSEEASTQASTFPPSTKLRCSPLFPFPVSLAPAHSGHGQQFACSQVCWQMWRREPVLVSAAWSGQSLHTGSGSQSCSNPTRDLGDTIR